MKSSEFLTLIAANANKTENLRSYFGPWPSSISRVSDKIAGHVGRIIAFVQAKINEGYFCKKLTEYLLIYNFQPLYITVGETIYYSLDTLRKPMSQIKHVKEKTGEPIQLVINGVTGEVMNNSKFMIEAGLATENEVNIDELDAPISYGFYLNYPAPTCFVASLSDYPLLAEAIFDGLYDQKCAIQEGQSFENLLHARQFLEASNAVGRYILEVPYSVNEIPYLKKSGLGKKTVKFMDFIANTIVVNADPIMLIKEEPVEDELSRLKAAFGMEEPGYSKDARIAVAKALELAKEKKVKPEMPGVESQSLPTSPYLACTEVASYSRIASSTAPSAFFSSSLLAAPLKSDATIKPYLQRKVLIVDDNIVNQKMLARIVKAAGHEFQVANDGIEALEAYNKTSFNLIFMDIVMPNMDGLTATREIRKMEVERRLPKTPIIAITAHASMQDRAEGLKAGIDEYVAKPFTKDIIQKKISMISLEMAKANV